MQAVILKATGCRVYLQYSFLELSAILYDLVYKNFIHLFIF